MSANSSELQVSNKTFISYTLNLPLESDQRITVSPGDILTCSVKEYRTTMSIHGHSETFTQLTRFVFLLDKLSLVNANWWIQFSKMYNVTMFT